MSRILATTELPSLTCWQLDDPVGYVAFDKRDRSFSGQLLAWNEDLDDWEITKRLSAREAKELLDAALEESILNSSTEGQVRCQPGKSKS